MLFPAIACAAWGVAKLAATAMNPWHEGQASKLRYGAFLLTFSVATLQPALVLIDHGHFQYNGIGLGLTVSA